MNESNNIFKLKKISVLTSIKRVLFVNFINTKNIYFFISCLKIINCYFSNIENFKNILLFHSIVNKKKTKKDK